MRSRGKLNDICQLGEGAVYTTADREPDSTAARCSGVFHRGKEDVREQMPQNLHQHRLAQLSFEKKVLESLTTLCFVQEEYQYVYTKL